MPCITSGAPAGEGQEVRDVEGGCLRLACQVRLHARRPLLLPHRLRERGPVQCALLPAEVVNAHRSNRDWGARANVSFAILTVLAS